MFETELKYFIENQTQLVKKHAGKILVLRGKSVVGIYDDALEAYVDSKRKYQPGTFMIQTCSAGTDAYTVSLSPAYSAAE